MYHDIIREIKRGNNIIIIGEKGIGKTYIIKQIVNEDFLYFDWLLSIKSVLLKIVKRISPNLERISRRESIKKIMDIIIENLDKDLYVILDDFHNISRTGLRVLEYLIKNCERLKFILLTDYEGYKQLMRKPEFRRLRIHFSIIKIKKRNLKSIMGEIDIPKNILKKFNGNILKARLYLNGIRHREENIYLTALVYSFPFVISIIIAKFVRELNFLVSSIFIYLIFLRILKYERNI